MVGIVDLLCFRLFSFACCLGLFMLIAVCLVCYGVRLQFACICVETVVAGVLRVFWVFRVFRLPL